MKINRHSWNHRTDVHFKSEFYDMGNFMKGKISLNHIELYLLEILKNKKAA